MSFLIPLLVCWFLFAFPAIILYAVVQGARLFAQAGHGQVPGLLPKFGSSRSKQDNGNVPVQGGESIPRLPRV